MSLENLWNSNQFLSTLFREEVRRLLCLNSILDLNGMIYLNSLKQLIIYQNLSKYIKLEQRTKNLIYPLFKWDFAQKN